MIRTLLTIFFSLVITLAVTNISIWAHEGHEHAEGSEKKVVNIVGNVVGEESGKIKLQCPVTKDWFVLDEKTPKTVYKEKTYYFCCPACKPKFDKDTEKYISEEKKKS